MATIDKNLGTVTAYKYAKNAGYEGTEVEFAQGLKNSAEYAENAQASATAAAGSASAAAGSAGSAAQWAAGNTPGTPGATNNAKYFAEQAAVAKDAAEEAQGKAEDAQAIAEAYARMTAESTSFTDFNTEESYQMAWGTKDGFPVLRLTAL